MVRRVCGLVAVSFVALACHRAQDATPQPDPPSTATPPDTSLVGATAPAASTAAATSASASATAAPSASVESMGMIGLLNSGGGGDPNAPTAPWGRDDSLGDGGARGNMWGEAIGDSFGYGGLGLAGSGSDGGARGEGIGLGNVGTIGHGSGTGHNRTNPPHIRQGTTTVNGRLPPEVIQRIVRQNYGRFRLCYEEGLRRKPSMQGRVVVKLVISANGNVTSTKADSSTLGDAPTDACITRAFANLSFPQPESGIVTVLYGLILSPPDP
jgi:hypothetical protein